MSIESTSFLANVDPRIASALGAIRSAGSNPITIAGLALSVNLSQSRFRNLFTLQVGMTPARYLKTVRLYQADVLVRETFLTIKQVMAATGFNDESHFFRDYKSCFGCTPSARRGARFGQ